MILKIYSIGELVIMLQARILDKNMSTILTKNDENIIDQSLEIGLPFKPIMGVISTSGDLYSISPRATLEVEYIASKCADNIKLRSMPISIITSLSPLTLPKGVSYNSLFI